MKVLKKIMLSVLAIATLVMCFALTSCGDCDHVWGEWTATGEATCSGTAEKRVCSECEEVETRTNGDAKAHTWGAWTVKTAAGCITAGEEQRACSKCSAKETRPIAALGHSGDAICEVCFGTIFTLPEIDFSEYESVKVSLEDYTLTLNYNDDYNIIQSGTMTLDICEGYVGLDDDGALVGAFKAIVKMAGTVSGANNTALINGVIEGNAIYLGLEGAVTPDNTENQKSYVKYDLSSVAEAEQFAELEEQLAMVEELLPEIEEWYNETLAPVFADVNLEVDGAAAFAAKLVNSLLKKEVAADGSFTLSIDYDAIKSFNETLAEKKISELIDVIFGEGVYADVKAFITSDEFYALSVADVISFIETEQGVDLAELVKAIDALIAIAYPVPEGQTVPTVSAMLAGYMGVDPTEFDLVAFLRDETMADYSIMMALKMMVPAEDDPATEDVDEAAVAIKAMVEGIFTQAEAVSVYELILAGGANNEGMNGGSAPLSETEEPDPIAMMVEMVNDYIDQMAEMSGFTLYFDKNGAFVKSVLTITAAAPNLDLTATITSTATDVTLDFEFEMNMGSDGTSEAACTVKLLPNGTVSADTAAIARIKAAIAKVPTIDKATFFEIVKGEYFQADSDIALIDGDTLWILRVQYIGWNNELQTHAVEVTVFKFVYTETLSYINVTIGCETWIGIDFEAQGGVAKGAAPILNYDDSLDESYYVNTYFNVATANGLANFNAVIESIPEEAWDTDPTGVDFNYNTDPAAVNKYVYADNQYIGSGDEQLYRFGHLYVLDTEESELDVECGGAMSFVYKCSACEDTFVYYEYVSHYGSSTYNLIDEDLGLAGGLYKGMLCESCEEFFPEEDYVFYIDSELDAEFNGSKVISYNTYATFLITIGAEDVGTYNFFTEAEEEEYCDTYVTIYKWDSVNQTVGQYVTSDDDALPFNHCFASANLEEGTYLVGIRTLGGVYVDSFTFVIAAAE